MLGVSAAGLWIGLCRCCAAPPGNLDPFINFGSAFVSLLPVYLGLLPFGQNWSVTRSRCFGFGVFFDSILRGSSVFGLRVVGNSFLVLEDIATYVGLWLLLNMLVLWAHIKASNSGASSGWSASAAPRPYSALVDEFSAGENSL